MINKDIVSLFGRFENVMIGLFTYSFNSIAFSAARKSLPAFPSRQTIIKKEWETHS